jgi:DNA-binding PadR family transcriptional regulator
MLSIEPNRSGYTIRKAVEGSVNYFWGESYGQIYPTLKRLAAQGLIVARASTSATRPRRQEYSLTPAGHACLEEWLAVPYRDDRPRNEFLLKLFFGREAAPSVSIRHLRDFQEKNRRLLATLVDLETLARKHNAGNPNLSFWMLTLTFGIAQTRSALEWSESALAILSGANNG